MSFAAASWFLLALRIEYGLAMFAPIAGCSSALSAGARNTPMSADSAAFAWVPANQLPIEYTAVLPERKACSASGYLMPRASVGM